MKRKIYEYTNSKGANRMYLEHLGNSYKMNEDGLSEIDSLEFQISSTIEYSGQNKEVNTRDKFYIKLYPNTTERGSVVWNVNHEWEYNGRASEERFLYLVGRQRYKIKERTLSSLGGEFLEYANLEAIATEVLSQVEHGEYKIPKVMKLLNGEQYNIWSYGEFGDVLRLLMAEETLINEAIRYGALFPSDQKPWLSRVSMCAEHLKVKADKSLKELGITDTDFDRDYQQTHDMVIKYAIKHRIDNLIDDANLVYESFRGMFDFMNTKKISVDHMTNFLVSAVETQGLSAREAVDTLLQVHRIREQVKTTLTEEEYGNIFKIAEHDKPMPNHLKTAHDVFAKISRSYEDRVSEYQAEITKTEILSHIDIGEHHTVSQITSVKQLKNIANEFNNCSVSYKKRMVDLKGFFFVFRKDPTVNLLTRDVQIFLTRRNSFDDTYGQDLYVNGTWDIRGHNNIVIDAADRKEIHYLMNEVLKDNSEFKLNDENTFKTCKPDGLKGYETQRNKRIAAAIKKIEKEAEEAAKLIEQQQ